MSRQKWNSNIKAFDCVDHNKLWKILKEMGIPGHLICLLRNLYAGQDIIMELTSEKSCCSAGNNQVDEQAGITQHRWQLSRR